jgi:hypothetical protein
MWYGSPFRDPNFYFEHHGSTRLRLATRAIEGTTGAGIEQKRSITRHSLHLGQARRASRGPRVIRIADARVRALLAHLREDTQDDYATVELPPDEISARVRIADAWDLRYLSATRRAPIKHKYLRMSFALLIVELMSVVTAIVLAS